MAQSNDELSEDSKRRWKKKLESINSSLESICRNLDEYEDLINEESQEHPLKLFEMLETVNKIHAEAQNIRPFNDLLDSRQDDLRLQMELLQRSLDLVALEEGGLNALESSGESANRMD